MTVNSRAVDLAARALAAAIVCMLACPPLAWSGAGAPDIGAEQVSADGIRIAQAPPVKISPAPRPPHQKQPPGKNAQAQPTPAPAAPSPPAPAQSAPAAPAPAQTTPPTPIRTEILKFDNWTATCSEFAEPNQRRLCSAQLQVQPSGANQVLLTWGIAINDSKQLVMVLRTPTGVAIAPGVKLKLDKDGERTIPFETCDNGFCTAGQIIDNNLLRDITASANAQVTVQALNGNQVNFNFPITGAEKALTHLRSKL